MKSTKAFFRIVIACLLAVVMTSAVVACKPKNPDNPTNQKYNPEERPLSMSISTPDGVFNPFFATSAYDSSIVGMTQISMRSSDKEGNIVCGDNEPVVVKDYRVTTNSDVCNSLICRFPINRTAPIMAAYNSTDRSNEINTIHPSFRRGFF